MFLGYRFCVSREGGTCGGGWVYLKGANSVAVSGLGLVVYLGSLIDPLEPPPWLLSSLTRSQGSALSASNHPSRLRKPSTLGMEALQGGRTVF